MLFFYKDGEVQYVFMLVTLIDSILLTANAYKNKIEAKCVYRLQLSKDNRSLILEPMNLAKVHLTVDNTVT